MTDMNPTDKTESPTPLVKLPNLCNTHQVLLVGQTGYGPKDPWQALMISTQIAMFQGASGDQKVYEEMDGKIENIDKIGCPCLPQARPVR